MRFRFGGIRSAGAVVVALNMALVAAPAAQTQAAADTGPSGITAKGAYLLDSTANKELWSKAGGTSRAMASTTKIMTAVVVLDTPDVDLDQSIEVKEAYRDYAAAEGASTADLKAGDKLTVRQLLYGLMLPSGCDAAYALADTFGSGSTIAARTKSFIGRMNRKAEALGLTNSRYDSFDGISPTGDNHSSPRDLAKLARYAMEKETFQSIVKSQATAQKAADGRVYTWYNTNRLVGSYRGVVGIKTGTGTAAGSCLVFAAIRDGRTVIGVVLDDAERYTSAARMLDWVFGSDSASTLRLRLLPQDAQED